MDEGQSYLGSELFCQAIADSGTELMFGIPGGVVLPLYDKLNKCGHQIRHILPRHEQGGGFAADGAARVTGKPGLALGTSGPGATNLLTAIVNSMMDSVPVVYITGQVADDLVGTDAFQETDLIGMTLPVVKHSYYVNNPNDICRVVKEAFYLAGSGRPGPIHIDVTKNAWLASAPYQKNPDMDLPGYKPIPQECTQDEVTKIDEILSRPNAKPIIIAGHGVEIAHAQEELLEFARKHNIPVVSTLLGLGSFPQGDALWAGWLGMHGDAVANLAVSECNIIIGAGIRFDDRITGSLKEFIEGKTFVHLEIDPSEVGKNVPTHLPLLGDLKRTLQIANKILPEHKFESWWARINQLKKEHGFLDFKYAYETTKGLSQARIVKMVSDATDGEAIVASDVGRHQMWVARFYRFKHPNSHLSSGGLGSMGYGMPAAMGAQLAAPDREVWAFSGDGGFMMNMQELITIAEHKISVKIAIMEDHSLGMVRQWQNLLFKGNISHSNLYNPDFVKYAECCGVTGLRATTYEEAEDIIKKAREIDGPVLLVFEVDPNEHVFPMIPPNTALANQALCNKDLLGDFDLSVD